MTEQELGELREKKVEELNPMGQPKVREGRTFKMVEVNEQELREKIADILLELRQYLCNTEFAPEPFTEPVDIEILRVKYPNQILALIDAYYKEKYAGYVKLAEDQTLPQNPFDTTKSGLEKSAYNAFEVAKLRYGNWRKVIIGGR